MFNTAHDFSGTGSDQLTQFESTKLQTSEILNRVNMFEQFKKKKHKYSLQELNSNETTVAEEQYWATTQAVGWFFSCRSDSSVLEFGLNLYCLVYIYVLLLSRTIPLQALRVPGG